MKGQKRKSLLGDAGSGCAPSAGEVSRERRNLLKGSAAALGLAFLGVPAMAGPFTRKDFDKLVPADKKLTAEWVKSMFERGTPEVLREEDLKYVGMPVGGIGAGHLYLGGDGRLWHWDIFNQFIYTPDRDGCHYSHQLLPKSPLRQHFSLKLGEREHLLDRTGFAEVSFRGEYPIGTVDYADPSVPLRIRLEAFSPFIPLNTDDSSLPVTVLQFTLHNPSTVPVTATLCGELENAICLGRRNVAGILRNRLHRSNALTQMLFSAEPAPRPVAKGSADWLESLADYGTMSLALLGPAAEQSSGDAAAPFGETLYGRLERQLNLKPGESQQVTFLIAWHFPNLSIHDSFAGCGRYYANKFSSAAQTAEYVALNFQRLAGQTRLWRDNWYNSTLPYWFLDRTFLNTSILATSTIYRLRDGRFWGWEGVGNCQGTCGHVYQYAHAIARLFPELERDLHERVDFGLAQMPDGAIHFRGEFNDIPAIDAQSGYILRALREHQVSSSGAYLRRLWPRIKLATQWLMAKDADGDGLIESNQHNTLDTDWYGKVAWLSGLYLAALSAAVQMATEVGDAAFAQQCQRILVAGRKNIVGQLFDGEYFSNLVDPAHLDAINSGTGCEIDQVMGQGWAFQLGLPRVFPEKETLSALRSLWRYNFTPDAGPYREAYKPGRWYAMPGEAGLLMCTFPREGWDYRQACGKGPEWAAGYFNECMNGFEYQAAGHMIWEGMVQEGLAITRAVHERYHASRRNPWNEIECGDHYARSMASYGVYLAACGFEYHGPKQHIGFAPKLTPESFRCAFTAAEGWGSYTQRKADGKLNSSIAVHWGKLTVRTIALEDESASTAHLAHNGVPLNSNLAREGKRVLLSLSQPLDLGAGEKLEIELS